MKFYFGKHFHKECLSQVTERKLNTNCRFHITGSDSDSIAVRQKAYITEQFFFFFKFVYLQLLA